MQVILLFYMSAAAKNNTSTVFFTIIYFPLNAETDFPKALIDWIMGGKMHNVQASLQGCLHVAMGGGRPWPLDSSFGSGPGTSQSPPRDGSLSSTLGTIMLYQSSIPHNTTVRIKESLGMLS